MKLRYGMGLLAAAGIAVLALLPALQADEPVKPQEPAKLVDPGSLPEVQDVIFLTEKRPLLMRLRLYSDGKPAVEAWETFQKKLFEYLDIDGDGFLSKDEAARVIPAATLVQLSSSNLFFNNIPAPPAFEDLDIDRDGKISPAELAAYYRRWNAGPFTAQANNSRGATEDQLTNVLFTALDANKDGKLSKAELEVADRILMKFDDNDDEMVSPQELLGTARNPFFYAPPIAENPLDVTNHLLLVAKEEGKNRITQRLKFTKELLGRYDKDKNNKLSRHEIGFPKELFDALDANKDGELDALELLRWLIAAPDLDITVRLGNVERNVKWIESATAAKDLSGLKPHATSTTTLALSFENSEVSIVRGNSVSSNPRQMEAQFQRLRQVFKQLDKEEKGFLTLKQLDDPRFMYLKSIFTIADRDGDGRLTEKELQAYIDLAVTASGAQLAVTFSDHGQGLFQLIDANGDGRLSIREMRTAWKRLAQHDRDRDGCISKNEIPRQYQLLIGQAAQVNGRQPVQQPGYMTPSRVEAALRGPLWFRKMDVNGDGDVSEREFLGSREDFRRIDLDGDGLISVEEAEKADEWFRNK